MRPSPVHASACGADLKIVVVATRQRWQHRFDRRLRNRMKLAVAPKTTGERREGHRTVPPQHFDQLALRIGFAHEMSICHGSALEQLEVAREQYARLPARQGSERVIVRAGAAGGIEAEEAETSRQLGEMSIRRESNCLRDIRPRVQCARQIDGVERWKHGDAVAVLNVQVERGRFFIDRDKLNLRMQYYDAYDSVHDRAQAGKIDRDRNLPQ